MPDHRRIAGCTTIRHALSREQRSDVFTQRISNANALKIRQTNRAMLAPARTNRVRKRKHASKGNWPAINKRAKTLRGLMDICI